jgi:hypothetical protein
MLIPSVLALVVIAALIATIVHATTGKCPLWVPVFMGLFVQAVVLYGGAH